MLVSTLVFGAVCIFGGRPGRLTGGADVVSRRAGSLRTGLLSLDGRPGRFL